MARNAWWETPWSLPMSSRASGPRPSRLLRLTSRPRCSKRFPDKSSLGREGKVVIDDRLNSSRISRIGRVRHDGQFDIVWSSGTVISGRAVSEVAHARAMAGVPRRPLQQVGRPLVRPHRLRPIFRGSADLQRGFSGAVFECEA